MKRKMTGGSLSPANLYDIEREHPTSFRCESMSMAVNFGKLFGLIVFFVLKNE